MSATEELRRMLDERGIEHYDHDHREVRVTEWDNGGKRDVRYEEWSSGTVRFDASNVTAEQAIAATTGRETCQNLDHGPEPWFVCSECGRTYQILYPRYCPNCGRRVVV